MSRLAGMASKDMEEASYRLAFSRNDKGIITVTGEIKSELTVVCQRCLHDMVIPILSKVCIGIVNQESDLDALDEGLEPFQAEDGKISVLKLIEDEILLGLPLSPMHENVDCPATESLQEYTAEKQNPFAVLKSLKRGKT